MSTADGLRRQMEAAMRVGLGTWSEGERHEHLANVALAVLPEHEKQIRAKVAEEILADVAAFFASRVGVDLWEAAYRAAWVARGES